MNHRQAVASSVLAAALAVVGTAVPVHGQDVEVGEVRVVAPDGGGLDGGGSQTSFTLDLPDGASCPGDSTDDGYRVNSYMVPEAVAPTEVTYDGLGPTPQAHGSYDAFRQPLFEVTTTWFVSALTADAEDPGEPGLILDLPAFAFGVYGPGDLPAGRYRIGVACTLLNEISRVWDTRIEVLEDPRDEPAGIRWRVLEAASSGSAGGIPAAALALGPLSLALGAIALARHHRRRRTAPVPLREEA